MKIKNLHDLFVNELRDMYHAEKQLVKALPKMAKAAARSELRHAFEEHLEQTRHQVSRLESVFKELDQKAHGMPCEAMKGLVTEGSDIIENAVEPAARDAGLIAAAQKVEHYEIASYGCLLTWAEQLGLKEAPDLLNQTLEEEKAADAKLNALALDKVNREAKAPMEEGEDHREEESQVETTAGAATW